MNLHNIHVSLKYMFFGIIFEFISLLSLFGSINDACQPFYYLALASIPAIVCMIIGVVITRNESEYFKKGFIFYILTLIIAIVSCVFLLLPYKELVAVGIVLTIIGMTVQTIGNLIYVYAADDVFEQSRNFKLAKFGKNIIYLFVGTLIVSVIFGILGCLPGFSQDFSLQIIFSIIRFLIEVTGFLLFFIYVLKGKKFTRAE